MKNNYDAVRLGLAFIVVLSHIGALSGHPGLHWMIGTFDSDFAVKGFFAISGCLVSRSYCASARVRDYAEKRARRIYPAYFTVVVCCTLLGALVGRLPAGDYFANPQTWKYLAANLGLAGFLQPNLPGVFTANPLHAVNGALWTIKVEVMLYFLVPVLVWAFRRWGALATAAASVLVGAAWRWLFEAHLTMPGGTEIARQFPGQLAYFGMGAVIGLDPRSARWLVPVLVVSAMLFVVAWSAPWRGLVEPVFYACLVIWLSTGTPVVEAGRHGDLSYGLYLVHFPIIQTIVAAGLFHRHPVLGAVACVAGAFGAAYASWHLVEKRTLRRTKSADARGGKSPGGSDPSAVAGDVPSAGRRPPARSFAPIPLDARPLVSVIVPVHNVERFVAESLESIAAQTYRDIEVIVVDDGSTDSTFEIVGQVASGDARFVVLRNERNLGIVDTMNRALAVARGALVARCDGDDVMAPDRLERQLAWLRGHPEVALVGCSFMTIDERGRELRVFAYPSGPRLLHDLLPFMSPVSHIWLARRELYDALQGYRLATVEDYDFLLRADASGYGLDNIPGYVGMKVRMRSGNTVGRHGLTQRVLFNYALRLYLHADRLRYSPDEEAALVAGSRRGALARAHYLSDVLTSRGARSACRPCAFLLYFVAAICSPYKAQHFYRRVRVKLLERRGAARQRAPASRQLETR